jgi:hypothetical protein
MGSLHTSPPGCGINPGCPDEFGCPPDMCPDFEIKRHDTVPSFKVSVEDDTGPLDLTGLVLEANMWVNAKFKRDVTSTDTTFQLADNIGFDQILVNDIIVPDRVRSPEHMRVIGFDETAKTVEVERGYNDTTPSSWKRGTGMRIFRILNASAVTEMLYENITQVDGCVLQNQLTESFLVYEWSANDTCVPGCFWFEFKLLKMMDDIVIPSVTPVCFSGAGVEWVRRFPVCGEFLIKICPSPTAEL